MGILNKLKDSFKMNQNDNDDYFLDDEYYEDDEVNEADSDKGGFFNHKSSGNSYDKSVGLFGSRKVISGGAGNDMQVVSVKPAGLNESTAICDMLLDGKAVILNLEGINYDAAQRIIDFMMGALYSMNGNLKQITNNIFILSPETVDVSGDFIKSNGESNTYTQPKNNSFSFNV